MNVLPKTQAHEYGKLRTYDAKIPFHLTKQRFAPEICKERQAISDWKGRGIENVDQLHFFRLTDKKRLLQMEIYSSIWS
jgi:hypothetical protein